MDDCMAGRRRISDEVMQMFGLTEEEIVEMVKNMGNSKKRYEYTIGVIAETTLKIHREFDVSLKQIGADLNAKVEELLKEAEDAE